MPSDGKKMRKLLVILRFLLGCYFHYASVSLFLRSDIPDFIRWFLVASGYLMRNGKVTCIKYLNFALIDILYLLYIVIALYL